MRKTGLLLVWFALSVSLVQQTVSAQSTEFTYQGRLLFGGEPANGAHDFEFRLFSDPDGNAQVGTAISLAAVNVVNGVFSVRLDFGNQFPGANRYLEIRVRQAGQEFYAVLAPRQAITSAPYAVRSLTAESATNSTNAAQLGGLTANQYVLANDSRMSDARPPLPNSGNYIQNTMNTNTPQNADFNISGFGTVGATLTASRLTITQQFNIGADRVMFNAGTSNMFVGAGAGFANSGGTNNSFLGFAAGSANTAGSFNSYFGSKAGEFSTGNSNSFFGRGAGFGATTGNEGSLFGALANSATGLNNATAIGSRAYVTQNNSLVLGSISGVNGAAADTLVGIGTTAPAAKLEVHNGDVASTGAAGGRFAANNPNNQNARVLLDWFNDGANDYPRIRYGGSGQGSASGFLIQGPSDATKFAVLHSGNVGIGTAAPAASLHVRANNGNVLLGHAGCSPGFTGIGFGASLSGCANYSLLGNGTDTIISRPAGGALHFREGNTTHMSIHPGGEVDIFGTVITEGGLKVNGLLVANANLLVNSKLTLGFLGAGSATHLCWNSAKEISSCSSSIRYKSNVNPFRSGLHLVNRLRPVSFNWKADKKLDFGLIAEEVAEVEPLLAFKNDKGEVEGVKYDLLGVVLINAVQEQQQQIEAQQKRIEEQQNVIRIQMAEIEKQRREFAELIQLVCAQNPTAELCQAKK